MPHLTLWDFILAPVFLFVLSAVARMQRNKYYPVGHPLRPYYMMGLNLKFGGAIFLTMVYEIYYNGGSDSFHFFYHAEVINSSFNDSVISWFKLLTRQSPIENPEIYQYTSRMDWYHDVSSYTVASIAAVLGLFTGMHYLPTALLFAYFSFTGIWAMYRTFVNIYPKLHKELALAFLFIPSTFIWGSSIFKDTLCMFGLGWLTYTTFRIFINRDFSVRNLVFLILSFYLISKVKMYILLGFLPALSIWLLTTYSSKIKSSGLRFFMKIGFIAITIAGFLFFTQLFANELQRYSLDKIAYTAAETRNWLTVSSGDEGSTYDLGEFEPTIAGMLKKFPQAVVVTLFRPFPWEARKVFVMLSSLEALAFLYFTIMAFRANGIGQSLKLINKDPNILFWLIFSILFAFAVGISSYNFGALSRYKIPCLPFYAAFLMVLLHHKKLAATTSTPQAKSERKEGVLA